MPIMLSLLVATLALAAAVWASWKSNHGYRAPDPAPSPAYDDSELRSALVDVIEGMDELRADYTEFRALVTEAVDNAIRDIKRKENRIRATVRRAREELEDVGQVSPGLAAEARELFGGDGSGGDEGGVPAVQGDVAGPEQRNRFADFPGDWSGYGG